MCTVAQNPLIQSLLLLLLLNVLINRPSSYSVPLFPFVPALSVGLNTFLLGQLDRDAYIRFGIWTVAVTGNLSSVF
jgi:hypothetical protein